MKKQNFILLVLMLISIGTFAYSLVNFIDWNKDNKITQENIEIINNKIIPNKKENHFIDFNYLKSINKDTKGWIFVKNTNINYPFVQSKDNEYYLNKSFDKRTTESGWVFLDYRNDINNLSRNNILYAHSRKDKTMFGSLKFTLKDEWLKNKNNHTIELSTENEILYWKVFSIYHIKTESYYIKTNFTKNEFNKFIKTIKKRSIYNFNETLQNNDIILTLSTCYNEDEKLVLHAKLIKREKY